MYVILDWVANHTAWDHAWITDHPDWYTRDSSGQMIAPFDWTDVAELDDSKTEVHDAMIEEMKFWITEADIDGFRCDVAMEVPVEFWDRARVELDEIKPVFMLAEAEEPDHHRKAFDMSYAWELHHIMNSIAKGKKNANDLEDYFNRNDKRFPADAYRMTFITNHDENSWNGTEYERMGDAVDVFAMLSYTLPGMPMIYTGQEAAFNRRLLFFDKDSVDWGDYALTEFYQELGDLRKKNPALWSGISGGKMKRIKTNKQEDIYAFFRRNDDNTLAIITNLSPERKTFKFKSKRNIQAKDYYSGDAFSIGSNAQMTLGPWAYKILIVSE
jgi:glycosidase